MNPKTQCCRNCVHALWKYWELGSIDRDELGACQVYENCTIRPSWGTLCQSFEPSSNPVTEESKRMKEAAMDVSKLAGELYVRYINSNEGENRSGKAGDWFHQSETLRYAAEIMEREAK